MINNQLKTYIEGEQAKGKTLEVIKDELLTAGGWNVDDIVDTFESIKPGSMPVSESTDYQKIRSEKRVTIFTNIHTILLCVFFLSASFLTVYITKGPLLNVIFGIIFVTCMIAAYTILFCLVPLCIVDIVYYLKLKKNNIINNKLLVLFTISFLILAGIATYVKINFDELMMYGQNYGTAQNQIEDTSTADTNTEPILDSKNDNGVQLDLSPLMNQGMADPELLNPLKEQFNQPADFDGHYRVGMLGCGSGCASFVIMDKDTGKVYLADSNDYGNFSTDDVPKDWSQYTLDSNLIHIVTSSGKVISTYSFNGVEFKLVSSQNIKTKEINSPKDATSEQTIIEKIKAIDNGPLSICGSGSTAYYAAQGSVFDGSDNMYDLKGNLIAKCGGGWGVKPSPYPKACTTYDQDRNTNCKQLEDMP